MMFDTEAQRAGGAGDQAVYAAVLAAQQTRAANCEMLGSGPQDSSQEGGLQRKAVPGSLPTNLVGQLYLHVPALRPLRFKVGIAAATHGANVARLRARDPGQIQWQVQLRPPVQSLAAASTLRLPLRPPLLRLPPPHARTICAASWLCSRRQRWPCAGQ